MTPGIALAVSSVAIIEPQDGEVLFGPVELQANVVTADVLDTTVEFIYDPHEDTDPPVSIGFAIFDAVSGLWVLNWDTTTVLDTYNIIDTDNDGIEDTTVNITKPPTLDELSVVATRGAATVTDATDIRIQNMLTVRTTLPDNQEDLRGFQDLEVLLTSEFPITNVRFDIYDIDDADPRINDPFGEISDNGEPIENPNYGRPLGAPLFPTGTALYPIGTAIPEGELRWVYRGWDTTTVPDGTYALVATATDGGGRSATYMVETYIINDLSVVITAPDDGDTVTTFVALEARTSSFTGADNALPGGLWPATAVDFVIGATTIPATETPAGSGRWRAVWDSSTFAPGPYTITANATNNNPNGAENASDSVNVTLVAPGADLEAFFPFDFSTCVLYSCSFLDNSSGGPTSWTWDFGDGNTSNAQLPTHTYASYGVYEVSLTVSNGTDTDTYSRVIPVGNVNTVGFNINPINDGATEFIDWTSAFKDFAYSVGSTLAVPVLWEASTGPTEFLSMPTVVCDSDEDTSNQQCVIFTPEEAFGTAPVVVDPPGVGPVQDGVLFTMTFTEVQFRGITDIFKGKANLRIRVAADSGDGNPDLDWTAQLGTNVDVTNTDVVPGTNPVVNITSPINGAQVAGIVPIEAATVSTVTADQVEFFVNGTSVGLGTLSAGVWTTSWDTSTVADGSYGLTAVATFGAQTATSAVVTVQVANAAPTASIDTISCTDLTCDFTGSGTDAGGTIELYTWTFLEGTTVVGTKFGASSTFTFPGAGDYTVRLTVTDNDGGTGSTEQPLTVTALASVFQVGSATDATNEYLTYPYEICEPPPGETDCPSGAPPVTPIPASMTAQFSNIAVIPGDGVIGGDALEFDVTITNNSPIGSGVVLSAFAFQSKVSESPALASRIGDKAFYGTTVPGTLVTTAASALGTVKKNGTSNGLLPGQWKGICINSSEDFLPEFNSGLEEESLECGGNRADTDLDGEPEIQTGANMLGLRPGESQVIRIRIDSGTTDGALHVIEPGTLTGTVTGTAVIGPNGITYFVPTIDTPGNVIAIPDFGDNKVLRDADGTFNPTFAPAADGYSFANQQYLTLPRRNFAFTDLIGRNHSCATYGLTLGACSGGGQPFLNLLDTGDLVPGVQNFAAILRGYGEFYDANGDFIPDTNPLTGDVQPSYPYDVRCDNCGGLPYVPIAEFYVDNGDGTVTQQMVSGNYGDPIAAPYLATVDTTTAGKVKQEVIPELDPGGPCIGGGRKPACAQLDTAAVGEFRDLVVIPGGGINGGDAIEFIVDITNNSSNPNAYLTAFNYQTKRRSLADIGVLDGFTQDRRDVRVDPTLPLCTGLNDASGCYNASLGVGQFPNVIGNGLLFGQMVWTNNDAGREGPVVPDQVFVDPVNGIDPVPFWLESVKKNGPFSSILKGNTNFICIKSGLFDNDPDADAACAGEAAILLPEASQVAGLEGELIPANIAQRLGLPPGETQTVRIRQEFGDFRGAMLQILAGTLTDANVRADYSATRGLARQFDCEDQRELEFCHPYLVGSGQVIGYLPNTDAEWLTPQNLEDIEYVIINQPGDAPTVMNFQDNLGLIMAMAGFIPSAEFYAPDPSEDLEGTPYEGVLIRQQVLGQYEMTDVPALATTITSAAVTTASTSTAYSYDVNATAFPGPVSYSLSSAPSGMSINSSTGVISWTPSGAGVYPVSVLASNGTSSDTQSFSVAVASTVLDNFNRANGRLGANWTGATKATEYVINGNKVDVGGGGAAYWRYAFGASQEASFKLTTIDAKGKHHSLMLKAQKGDWAKGAILVSYDAVGKRVVVESRAPNASKWTTNGTYNVTMLAGDTLTAQARADGTVRVLVNGNQVGVTSPITYFVNRGGSIGVWFHQSGGAWFDDFGGGTMGS